MISDILTYISSYEEIRAVTGLNNQELPDSTLGLLTYSNRLSIRLNSFTGVYEGSEDVEDLQTIFDRTDDSDIMHETIQLFSIFTVAEAVMSSVGLRAYKTITDGKSNITRFSPESTYQDTRQSIQGMIRTLTAGIRTLFDETTTTLDYVYSVEPDVDLVLGDE